jgi:hypothetical protein
MTAREDNASKAQFALIVKHEKSVRFTTKERRDLFAFDAHRRPLSHVDMPREEDFVGYDRDGRCC